MACNTRARTIGANTWAHIECYVHAGLSPQQVSLRLKAEGADRASHERIYQHVYEAKRAASTSHLQLRCQKARRKRYASGRDRRGVLKNRVGIEMRPPLVESRQRIGDIEGDTIVGKDARVCWSLW